MHRMLVEERKWISEARFLHALNFCMLLPGPEAQQLATYVGWLLHGTRGGLVAGTLFVLPGLVVILVLSALYAAFRETAGSTRCSSGSRRRCSPSCSKRWCGSAGGRSRRTSRWSIAAVAFVAIFVLGVPFPVIVLGAGVFGYVAHPRGAGRCSCRSSRPRAERRRMPPTPASTGSSRRGGGRSPVTLSSACAVGGARGRCSASSSASTRSSPQIALFFSWLAVVTFGGAYAVLAYVADAAVTSYGWLNPGEMLDGLAMAETTPGPLIMVLSFVGFLAAFRDAGGLDPMVAGLLGGLLTAWVTFVPSFLWIFLGAPYMERLRGNRNLSGALAAITAAVVGVILNLALWLGLHVLFREVGVLDLGVARPAWPVWSTLDPWALGLMLVAVLALFRFHLGIPATLGICSVLGVPIRVAGLA